MVCVFPDDSEQGREPAESWPCLGGSVLPSFNAWGCKINMNQLELVIKNQHNRNVAANGNATVNQALQIRIYLLIAKWANTDIIRQLSCNWYLWSFISIIWRSRLINCKTDKKKMVKLNWSCRSEVTIKQHMQIPRLFQKLDLKF